MRTCISRPPRLRDRAWTVPTNHTHRYTTTPPTHITSTTNHFSHPLPSLRSTPPPLEGFIRRKRSFDPTQHVGSSRSRWGPFPPIRAKVRWVTICDPGAPASGTGIMVANIFQTTPRSSLQILNQVQQFLVFPTRSVGALD